MITISKKRFRKVKDVPWTLSKRIALVQESDREARQITAWKIRAFENKNKDSHCANAVLQCLLHLSIIRKKLLNIDKQDDLSKLAQRYESNMKNLNTDDIRKSLEEYISIKRDAVEFLTAICTKYDYVRNLVEHQVTCTSRCKSCGNTKVITDNNIVVPISIKNLKKKSDNLNDLLKTTFSHWCQSHDKSCEHCAGNDIMFKNELTLTKKIVIIHLILFSLQDNKVIKIPQKFNLNGISTAKVSIAKQQYKVMNAIFHEGSCIENDDYTSMCREGTSWTKIDEKHKMIKKGERWSTGARNIYILFLQKVDNKN